jgi:glycosyltransferase involved in cell wall biosynthesis
MGSGAAFIQDSDYVELSIIVACVDAGRSIRECLRRLKHACAGIAAELIVVDASADDTAAQVTAFDGDVRLVRLPYNTLTPLLWAEGYRQATGRVIAFTTGHCLVSPRWAAALIDAIDAGAAGAGGPLVLSPAVGTLDAAVYYLRYSAFTPNTLGKEGIAGEIAGDNAAYGREWLDRHADSLADGFWEVDFHRLVRADGGYLAAVPEAVVEFGRSFPMGTIARHRFAHGSHYGAARVHVGTRTAWQIVLAAPLVPFVLALRAAARVVRDRRSAARFVTALPCFLALATSWAFGEACGAINGALPATVPSTRAL